MPFNMSSKIPTLRKLKQQQNHQDGRSLEIKFNLTKLKNLHILFY